MALTKVTGQVIKNTTDVTVGVLTVTNTLAVGGTVSIGGTLTYEDVTNVDAVGLITARNGIVVGSGITLSKDGDVFFTGIATGNGSGLTALNASNLGSGTVPTARLGSGTASSSTFLRGDSTFATVTSTTINSNADNRVITGSGTADTLNGESNLTFDGSALGINVSSPSYTLDVVGDAGGSFSASTNSTNGVISVVGKNSGGSVSAISRIKSYPDGSSNQSHMTFETRNSSSSMVERLRIASDGSIGIGEDSPSNLLHVKESDTGINPHTSAQIVLERSGTNYLQFLTATDGTSGLLFGDADDIDVAQIKYDHNVPAMQFVTETGERMRIDNAGRILIGTTTAVGSNTPNLQVLAQSPSTGFDNHIYLEGNETSGAANTGGQIGFGGHDGNTARNWAAISGFKENGTSGNTSSFLSFKTRRSGVSGINEMWKITAMGSLLARDSKESAIGREWTNGSVPAGQTRDYTDNSRLNFNSIGGNGGGHITCLSVSSFDQNPSGCMIVAGVHGQGFNSYDTILSNFDSGISVTFTGGTISIQNTASETIYYSVNVIHMGTGNTTYLGR